MHIDSMNEVNLNSTLDSLHVLHIEKKTFFAANRHHRRKKNLKEKQKDNIIANFAKRLNITSTIVIC